MHHRRMIKKIIKSENKAFIICFIVTIILLSIPLIIRFTAEEPLIIGDKPYYHMRIAKNLIDYDPLSYMGRTYVFDPYNNFLSFGYGLFGNIFFIVLPFILGIVSVIIFFFIIKKLKLNLSIRFLIMLTLILSPIFVYTFTVLNKHSLIIFIMLLGFLFFINKSKLLNYFSIIIFCIIPFLNILASLITILLILSYTLFKKRKALSYVTLILIALITILFNLFIYLKYGFPEKVTFISLNYLQNFISDLGSIAGSAFFNIILTIVGIIVTWKYKKKIWLIYITILILLVTLSYYVYSNIYLKFIITTFTGIGFYKIISMRWKLKFIRDLSILIMVLGIIFSTTSHTNRLIKSLPDKNTKQSLEYLKLNSGEKEIILSHYTRGHWIEYYAERAVVMDSLFTYAPKPNEKYRDINAIFYGVDLQDTKRLLDKYQIRYIYIDNEMKQGLVWTKEKQGLLFLFRNEETFNQIYEEQGIEIWEYITS